MKEKLRRLQDKYLQDIFELSTIITIILFVGQINFYITIPLVLLIFFMSYTDILAGFFDAFKGNIDKVAHFNISFCTQLLSFYVSFKFGIYTTIFLFIAMLLKEKMDSSTTGFNWYDVLYGVGGIVVAYILYLLT